MIGTVDLATAMGISIMNNERCIWCDHKREYHLPRSMYAGTSPCGHQACTCRDYKSKEMTMPHSPIPSSDTLQSAQIGISADKKNLRVTITLPCGQKRTLSTATIDLLIERLTKVNEYLRSNDLSREF